MSRSKTALLAPGRTMLTNPCNQINDAYPACQLSSMCFQCVTTSGCEYNLRDATCTTASASNNSAPVRYCSSSDSVCAHCTVSSTIPTCSGEDGSCVCQSLCGKLSSILASGDCKRTTIITPATSDDNGFGTIQAALILGALCIVTMLYVQYRIKKQRAEHHIRILQVQEARRQQHRREREMLHESRPELTLNLETWRNHVELHKPQPHASKIELETCYYLMMQEDEKNDEKGESQWDSLSKRVGE